MHPNVLRSTALSLSALLVLSAPALAQDDSTQDVPQTEAPAETPAETTAEAPTEAAAEAPAETTLEDIAATSDDMEMRDGEEGEPDTMVMLSDVLFGFGSATLTASAVETLTAAAPDLAELSAFTVEGHTDSIGDPALNIQLGTSRAQAVRDWLVGPGGLAEDQITVVGVGEVDPLVPNRAEDGTDLPENRAQNRRVEFVVPGDS